MIIFQNPVMSQWITSLCGGLCNPKFGAVFQYLMPNCDSRDRGQTLSRAVSDPRNGSVEDGAVYCLVYGYNNRHVRATARGMHKNSDGEHRLFLQKRYRHQKSSRSRSHSPSSSDDDGDDDDNLADNVYDPQNPDKQTCMRDIFSDPDTYLVRDQKLHVYFESHKSDFLVLKSTLLPDPDFPGFSRNEYMVKIVIEIASSENVQTHVVDHVGKCVQHCVESCLRAFSCNQDLMYGLVVVVDGFVLIKVEKQNQGGQVEYQISETDLIMWDNADSLHAMFYTLNSVL